LSLTATARDTAGESVTLATARGTDSPAVSPAMK